MLANKKNSYSELEAKTLLSGKQNPTAAEVKNAYRALTKMFHPDSSKNPDEEMIKFINVLYGSISKGFFNSRL